MACLVCFHAHPDDEAIATGGTMARAKAAGHRVVLVVATRGEHGEVADGVLAQGEQLGVRRVAETFDAAGVLGVDRVEFLGYVDSGMMGEPTNDQPYSFWSIDVASAAARLAAILEEESADALTVYDDHGNYGHPDHIQVHRVGVAAAALAGTPSVFEATMNRDHIRRLVTERRQEALEAGLEEGSVDERSDFGTTEEHLTHAIDVTSHLDDKRAAMKAHASQIPEDSWFLSLGDEAFRAAFGIEWFIERGHPRAVGDPFRTDLFA